MDKLKKEENIDLLGILNLVQANDSRGALSELLNLAIKQIGAEGGTFYSYHNHCLYPVYVVNKTLNIQWFQSDENTQLNNEYVIHLPTQPEHYCVRALQKQDVLVENKVQRSSSAKRYSKFFFDQDIEYSIRSILTIPIFDNRSPVGVFQLINGLDPETRSIRDFTETDLQFAYMIIEIASSHLSKIKQVKSKFTNKINIWLWFSLFVSMALIIWLLFLL